MRNKLIDQRKTQRERIVRPNLIEIQQPPTVQEDCEELYLGRNSVIRTASAIWETTNNNIANNGELLFGYKNTKNNSSLCQVILIKNYRYENQGDVSYGFSVVTPDYSMTASHVDIGYLEEIYKELVTFNVDSKILTIFRGIIENETFSN